MDENKATLVLLLVAAFSVLRVANADFVLSVKVCSYENRYRTLGPSANPQCCDGGDLPTQCSRSCDNKFVFCLRDSLLYSGTQGIAASRDMCTYGVYTTPPMNNDQIQFDVGSTAIQLSSSNPESATSNPLVFTGFSSLDAAQFAIEVIDADDPMGATNDQHIDTVIVSISNLTVSSTFTAITPHVGLLGHSNFTLAFLLSCGPNYYGSNCSVFCQSRDNASGHYSCDSQGGVVCKNGYTDASTFCVQCATSPGCSSVGGYCNSPGECLCLSGYSGTLCEIDLDPCGHTVPCLNNGNCANTGPNDYQCSCPDGFFGYHCEYNSTYNCSSDTCLNGGLCVNDDCVCAEGFSGLQCAIDLNDNTLLIVASVLGITLLIIIISLIVVTTCIIVSKKRRNKVQKMKRMSMHVPSPVDGIQLQPNPGYASLQVGLQQQTEHHYYSEIHDYISEGTVPQRSTSLPLRSHLAVQTTNGGSDRNSQQYERYVNEGLGPIPRAATVGSRQQPHTLVPLSVQRANAAARSPDLDDGNYAIPQVNSTTNLIIDSTSTTKSCN